ncbi:DUF4349 domain-containing protein [Mangrovibacterium diazotrophicum]|uniref:Uncharacterized protein DUF4349 n=1 Tax=Mangrovibacterium diazotrophicum TaxID=1261403 RepID=A0A419WBL6_9BACT|nr:DUF4349 domain-containing protein [Mangrovibacterium diazotrophicum]RKD92865.1 uncharacterized protein DUF4349 [Mangrovibacterium diazotrophicum]
MKNILSIFIFSLLFVSCHQKPSSIDSYAILDMAAENEIIPTTRQELANPPAPPLPPVTSQEVIKKKIIKDGRIGIEVNDLEDSKSRIDTLVKNQGGYYDNESYNNSNWESSYNLKVRIPSANFDRFLNAVETGKGEVKYKEIDARDVTDQFIDLETRLQNKKNYLKRYNELLAKAQTVKDILEIEEKIRGIEEEIESTTGRLNYLSDLVDYSTLDLTISKQKDFKYNPVKRGNFVQKLKQALFKGWYGLIDFTLLLFNLWPLWIFVAVVRYAWKKFRKKK